jgi:L-methionine (R)-S-oxide reductase
MADTVLDVRALPKEAAYEEVDAHINAVLEGIRDPIAGMATISCLLYQGFGHLWVGFYRVVEDGTLLRVGPYQGSLACLEIRLGSGVCGTAAAQRQSVIVPDVTTFPGHITCDPRSRSEIVVPVYDHQRDLIAVLDIDSEIPAAFDTVDKACLEKLLDWFDTANGS